MKKIIPKSIRRHYWNFRLWLRGSRTRISGRELTTLERNWGMGLESFAKECLARKGPPIAALVLLCALNAGAGIPYVINPPTVRDVGTNGQKYSSLSSAISAAKAGDIVQVVNGNFTFTSAQHLPAGVTLDGGPSLAWVTNALSRNVIDPANLTFEGPCIIPGDNCTIRNIRFWGQPTLYAQENVPAVGTIYFDANNNSFTNLLLQNVNAYNLSTLLYIRHTNTCTWVMRDCFSSTFKNPLFVSFGNHIGHHYNSTFAAIGPDLIPGDSGLYGAQGVRQIAGNLYFDTCTFIAKNPTNAPSFNVLFVTNAVGYQIEYSEGFQPSATLIACRFETVNTNSGGATALDIQNGKDSGEAGVLTLSGCTFDRTKVSGPFQEIVLPITGGVAIAQNTNTLVVTGTGDTEFGTDNQPRRWGLSNSLPQVTYTNGDGFYYMTGHTGVWVVRDQFDASVSTSSGAAPTNGPWTSVSGGLPSMRYYWQATTNNFVIPYAVTIATNIGSQVTGGGSITLVGGTTSFASFGAVYTPSSTAGNETNFAYPVAQSGYIYGLHFAINTLTPQAGTSIVATVYVNGVASALAATLLGNNAVIAATNNTTTVAVTEGDKISIGFLANTTLAGKQFNWTIMRK